MRLVTLAMLAGSNVTVDDVYAVLRTVFIHYVPKIKIQTHPTTDCTVMHLKNMTIDDEMDMNVAASTIMDRIDCTVNVIEHGHKPCTLRRYAPYVGYVFGPLMLVLWAVSNLNKP